MLYVPVNNLLQPSVAVAMGRKYYVVLMLYPPANDFTVMLGHFMSSLVEPVLSRLSIKCLDVEFICADALYSSHARMFLGPTSTKERIKSLAQGHNIVLPVRLEPATPRPQALYNCAIFQSYQEVFLICFEISKDLDLAFYLSVYKLVHSSNWRL